MLAYYLNWKIFICWSFISRFWSFVLWWLRFTFIFTSFHRFLRLNNFWRSLVGRFFEFICLRTLIIRCLWFVCILRLSYQNLFCLQLSYCLWGLQEFSYFWAIKMHNFANCFDFGFVFLNSTFRRNWVCISLRYDIAYDWHSRCILDSLYICTFFSLKLRSSLSKSIRFSNSDFFSFAS